MKRRDFLAATAGAAGVLIPALGRAQTAPCPPQTVSVSGGTSIATSCVPAKSPTGLPKYMSGMADFDVRNLKTVSNGRPTMWDTLPTEWRKLGQPNGADNVFSNWSGGKGDAAGKRLFVHGGGHNDSSNNGLYIYDFNGDDAPIGWTIAPNSLSALSIVAADYDGDGLNGSQSVYSDNKPSSIHSYDQQWYDPNRNRFYRFSGSPYSKGSGTDVAYYYDVGASRWNSSVDGKPFVKHAALASLGSTLLGAPDGSQLLFLASTHTPLFVSATDGAVTPFGSALTGSEENQFASAMDTKRSDVVSGVCRYVALQSNSAGPIITVFSVDWKAKTWTSTVQALTGTDAADLNSQGACLVYDAVRDSFWALASRKATETGAVTSVYEINATKFTVSRYSIGASTDKILAAVGCKGGFNRHVWFPDWRIVATVHTHDAPMSLIKLPSA